MTNLISTSYLQEINPMLDLSLYTQTTLSGMISSASGRVEKFLGFDPALQTITDELANGVIDSDYNLVIYTKSRPIQSVTSIAITKGSQSVELNLVNGVENRYNISRDGTYILYPQNEVAYNGNFVLDSFGSIRGTKFFAGVTYVAGYQTIPEDIKYATALFVVDAVMKQQNLYGADMIKQGDITIAYRGGSQGATGSGAKGKSNNIIEAESILIDYRRVTP